MKKRKIKDTIRKNLLLGVIALVAVTFIAYAPVFWAGYVWDDWGLHDNLLILSPDGIFTFWLQPTKNVDEAHYWPLIYSCFWIEWRIWGDSPFFFHLMNVLLHVANSLLLWIILRRLKIPGALFAAALFALHPVHVESVAWIIERKDVLSALLYLLAFLMFMRFQGERKTRFYITSLFLFGCALFCKSVVISLPIALGLFLWWKKEHLRRKHLLPLIPYVVIVLIIVPLDLLLVRQTEFIKPGFSFLERILLISRNLAFYSQKMVFPYPLMPFYPKWNITTNNFLLYGVLLIETTTLFFLWLKRKQWGKGPLVAVLFYCFTLGPMLGLMDYGFFSHSYVADRFQYLASIGPIALFSAAAALLLKRLGNDRAFTLTLAGALLLLLGILTFYHSRTYKNEESLYSSAIKHNPESASGHYNLGVIYNKNNQPHEAIQHFKLAFRYREDWMEILSSIGWSYELLGNEEKAIEYYKRALETHPEHPQPHFRYGAMLMKQEHYDDAIGHFKMAVEFDPRFTEAYINLGTCYSNKNDNAMAIEYFKKAIEAGPLFLAAYGKLIMTLIKEGREEEARKYLDKALAINPDHPDVHYVLAYFLCKNRKYEESISHFKRTLYFQPDNVDVRLNYCVTLIRLGRFEEALRETNIILHIDPQNKDAGKNLVVLQRKLSRQ